MSSTPFEVPRIESLAALLPLYEFQHLIAQGGMGVVYKARQVSLDLDVAVKVLPREFGKDPLFRDCFEAEAKAMARLRHNNLISVYDFGDVDGLLYIVMEYVPGKSLHHSAHGKKIEPKQAVEIITSACEGIQHAHENGIIHRDFKPGNILLTPDREPKLGDFGLALSSGADGLPMGSPGYMSPELIRSPKTGSVQSDIFAIGAVLRELLSGVPAESPGAENVQVPDVKLAAICRKATHADPSQRHTSARELVQDLQSWMSVKPIATTSTPTPAWKPPGKVSLGAAGKSAGTPAMKVGVKPLASPALKVHSSPQITPTKMAGPRATVSPTVMVAAKPTSKVSLRQTAQVTVKAPLKPTAHITTQVNVKVALVPTAQITVKAALKPTALVSVQAAARPTASVSVKSAGKPAWKPAGKNGTRPKVAMSQAPQGSPLLRNCATIAVLLGTIYFLWGFYQTKQANIARQQSEKEVEAAVVNSLPTISNGDASQRHSGNKYDKAFLKAVAETGN